MLALGKGNHKETNPKSLKPFVHTYMHTSKVTSYITLPVVPRQQVPGCICEPIHSFGLLAFGGPEFPLLDDLQSQPSPSSYP